MGGAVIDTINNCGWLAGEQVIFSSPDEVTDFICRYGPSLIYSHYSAGREYPAVTPMYSCYDYSDRYGFGINGSSSADCYITF